MITIDYCIEEDGYVFFDQADGRPIPSIRCLLILEDEAVQPGYYGEIHLEPDDYSISIHKS